MCALRCVPAWALLLAGPLLGGCTDGTSVSQESLNQSYDVIVDCDDTVNDVAAVQSAVDQSIGQPTWTVKVVGTCDFAGRPSGLNPQPIPCNVDDACPIPLNGTRSCQPRESAPEGYNGFCFVELAGDVFLANADPFARATNVVFITSTVTIEGYEATIVEGGFYVGWDGDLIAGGVVPPDLAAGAPGHWDGVSYGVDLTSRYGGRWARAYPEIDVTVRGFHFEDGSVAIGAARNVLVEDNVISNVRSHFYDPWYKNGAVLRASGIVAGGGLLAPWLNVQRLLAYGDAVSALQPTGQLVVRRNSIDTVAEDSVDLSLAYGGEIEALGIFTVLSNSAIEISDNTIKDIAFQNNFELSKGIGVLDNLGTTRIDHNSVENSSSHGIYDWSMFLSSNHAVVTNNTITNCSKAGIGAAGGGNGEYRHNRIRATRPSARCIELDHTKASYVGQNVCTGAGDYALFVLYSDDHTFSGNNLASFDPGTAHIGLDHSNNNAFFGYSGTVLEVDSTGNTFTSR